MDRARLRDGDVVAVRATPEAKNGNVGVAQFDDDVTLKRFVRVREREVELRPESHNPAHGPIALDLAKHIVDIDGVAVGALIGELAAEAAQADGNLRTRPGPNGAKRDATPAVLPA